MLPTRDHDRVVQLRLRGVDDGARRRVAETLAGLSLHPAGLPPDAVLLIRRVAVTWDPHQRPAARAARLTRAVADLAARAARPADGPVPPDAEAVVFASTAELLACLARDGVHRRDAWWWSLLGETHAPPRFAEALLAAPRFVPGAFAWLAARRELPAVLAQILARDGRRLARALAETFGLPAAHAALSRLPDARPAPSPPVPWFAWAPEPAASSSPPPVILAALLALGLDRAEPALRASSTAAALLTWADAFTPAHARSPAPAPHAEPPPPAPVAARPTPPSTPALAPATPREDRPDTPPQLRPPRSAASSSASPPASPPASAPPPATVIPTPIPAPARYGPPPAPAPRLDPRPTAPPASSAAPVLEDSKPGPSTHTGSPPAEPPPDRPRPAAAAVLAARSDLPLVTSLGGSFYLIDVFLALDLYGDFTRPLHPGPGLPLWDLLAALTARLLAAPPPRDPLWGLLAGLAGRSQLRDGPAHRGAPADFAPPGAGHPAPAGGWPDFFAAVEAQVRGRLARAIDLPPPRWLTQRAEIRTGEARLDIHYALADHPPEVRLAGLDRDPGWIPAAGRDIRFWYDP